MNPGYPWMGQIFYNAFLKQKEKSQPKPTKRSQ